MQKELNAHIYIALSEPRTHCQKNPYKSLKETLKKNLKFMPLLFFIYSTILWSIALCSLLLYHLYCSTLYFIFYTHTHPSWDELKIRQPIILFVSCFHLRSWVFFLKKDDWIRFRDSARSHRKNSSMHDKLPMTWLEFLYRWSGTPLPWSLL